jgi:hypothetical protein
MRDNGPRLRLHTQYDNAEAQNARRAATAMGPPPNVSSPHFLGRGGCVVIRGRDAALRRVPFGGQPSNANPEPPPLRVATAAILSNSAAAMIG